VLSDVGQNAGISPESAVELAAEAKIPVFTVGLGSDPSADPRLDQRPGRAGPGVSRRSLHRLTGYVQAQGDGGQDGHGAVARPAGLPTRPATATGDVIETRQVPLGGDGERWCR